MPLCLWGLLNSTADTLVFTLAFPNPRPECLDYRCVHGLTLSENSVGAPPPLYLICGLLLLF